MKSEGQGYIAYIVALIVELKWNPCCCAFHTLGSMTTSQVSVTILLGTDNWQSGRVLSYSLFWCLRHYMTFVAKYRTWCLCLTSFYLSKVSIVERITLQIKRFGQNSVCQMNYWWFSKSPEKSLFFPVVNQSWGNNFHYITINQLFIGEIQMILHVNLDIIDNNDDYLCFAWKLKPKYPLMVV